MPFYDVTTIKSSAGYFWVNNYVLEAANLETAKTGALSIRTAELALHTSMAWFRGYKVALLPNPGRQEFFTTTETTPCTGPTATAATSLPPQLCAYVNFHAAMGRPGKKFYRYALLETEVEAAGEAGNITGTTARDRIQNALGTMIQALKTNGCELRIGTTYKGVTGVVLKGTAVQGTRHGWYNRKVGVNPT